jgi:transcriptional regulator with XRE-family HTH domain
MKYKVNVQLGRKIRRLRKTLKLSQEELAEKAGLHYTSLGRIERGEANPPVYTVYKIAKALKTPLHELFKFH